MTAAILSQAQGALNSARVCYNDFASQEWTQEAEKVAKTAGAALGISFVAHLGITLITRNSFLTTMAFSLLTLTTAASAITLAAAMGKMGTPSPKPSGEREE